MSPTPVNDVTRDDYRPELGEVVMAQTWSPWRPIRESPDGPPRRRLVLGIFPHEDPNLVRYQLANPERPNDDSQYSWSDAYRTTMQPDEALEGMLF